MNYVKKHITPEQKLLLVLCDDDILGRRFEEGDIQLDLSSEFYKGCPMNNKETATLIRRAYAINAVGEHAVALCIQEGVVEKTRVNTVMGIPYAQMVRF